MIPLIFLKIFLKIQKILIFNWSLNIRSQNPCWSKVVFHSILFHLKLILWFWRHQCENGIQHPYQSGSCQATSTRTHSSVSSPNYAYLTGHLSRSHSSPATPSLHPNPTYPPFLGSTSALLLESYLSSVGWHYTTFHH